MRSCRLVQAWAHSSWLNGATPVAALLEGNSISRLHKLCVRNSSLLRSPSTTSLAALGILERGAHGRRVRFRKASLSTSTGEVIRRQACPGTALGRAATPSIKIPLGPRL